MTLAGHVAWVTGGGRGIGRACALALAKDNCAVAVTARTAGEVDAVARECAALGVRSFNAVCDVTDAMEVARAHKEITQTLGAPDILINNAGMAKSAAFLKESLQSLDDHMQTNLHGAFHATQAALPAMLAKKWGRVVMVASLSGKIGMPYTAAYTASKHALVGLTRALAAEFAGKGVTVNAVCPGYVDTGLTDENIRIISKKTGMGEAEARQRLEQMNPQGRMTSAEEVAAVVLGFCEEEGGKLNGQAVTIDGGKVEW
jgi:3-hydroxybutyrate dehydrogenase